MRSRMSCNLNFTQAVDENLFTFSSARDSRAQLLLRSRLCTLVWEAYKSLYLALVGSPIDHRCRADAGKASHQSEQVKSSKPLACAACTAFHCLTRLRPLRLKSAWKNSRNSSVALWFLNFIYTFFLETLCIKTRKVTGKFRRYL